MTKSRTILWVLLLTALIVTGYFGWQRSHADNGAVKTGNAPKPAALAQAAAVPVTIAPVVKADFPV